ncbi:M28 family metallopeptidase [Aquabacterium sp. A7-Y]|uniref:M28 family metallopeptidase n=1 Tax=Aquabacterium sp. A7-Y TaxID=1349605 RepID=UPI00223D61D2|nr:M28 family metallopeptidase [Aquabacterium sp. A7-Y]MCW7538080.1 M28 family metallopeptidase [Aquabacterium sp. A7-Y]
METRLLQNHAYPPRLLKTWVAASVSALVLTLAGCGGGDDDDESCAERVNDTQEELLECVTLDGVRKHLVEFQKIADTHGNRASGEPGFDASIDYAQKIFTDAGYTVTKQAFNFVFFEPAAPSVLERVAPTAGVLAHSIMSYSGTGNVSAAVTVVPNLGCNATDFNGFPAGRIALIKRGTCPFGDKATNAANAGAAGVVIYNDKAGDLAGTLGDTFTADIPVVAVSQEIGDTLAATAGLSLKIVTQTTRETRTTYNLIAESSGGDPEKVVMVGAHLDSVHDGAGINDNGTGSAAILETAVQMAKVTPRNKLRFALWGGEESGLLGSTHYVEQLSEPDRAKISLYLNFDMIGSPNAGYFIYDGDDSDKDPTNPNDEGPGPAGSDKIEELFEAFYTARGKAFKGTDFDGRSDYGPFIAADIPAGGLFTGAEDKKTEAEVALWGGTAGEAYDKCYHADCDDIDNIDTAALDLNADAVAYATLNYAMSAETLTAQRVKPSSYKPPADMRPKHLPVLR